MRRSVTEENNPTFVTDDEWKARYLSDPIPEDPELEVVSLPLIPKELVDSVVIIPHIPEPDTIGNSLSDEGERQLTELGEMLREVEEEQGEPVEDGETIPPKTIQGRNPGAMGSEVSPSGFGSIDK